MSKNTRRPDVEQDDARFCAECGARVFGQAHHPEGSTYHYTCTAEVFVIRGGTVRVVRPCPTTKGLPNLEPGT